MLAFFAWLGTLGVLLLAFYLLSGFVDMLLGDEDVSPDDDAFVDLERRINNID